jgi:hypothetical protein
MKTVAIAMTGLFLLALALGQDQKSQENAPSPEASGRGMQSMPGMNMEDARPMMHAMEGHHMDMGPHMKMTRLREIQPGDEEKAQRVAEAARKVAEQYRDYNTALADGFQIFLPNVPQKQYHFTKYQYAFEARHHFNPYHPTSLLYEKHGDGYKLIGVMYTDRKGASEEELNQRIPLSIAQWHAHVNLCMPPRASEQDLLGPKPQFGLAGSISSKAACDAAGGKFIPQIFGWMVHIYPFEQKPENIWSVERQTPGHMD